MDHTRREVFRAMAWVFSMLGLRAAEPMKRNMIIRSARPEDFEMSLDGLNTWITPIERFFVRSHLYNPVIDSAKWRLEIGGEVVNPLTLVMADLEKFPRVELVSVLECAGNGRGFYRPTVAGLQWQYGAVGNAHWRGVRLAEVLRKAGIKPSAREVAFNGADVPIGTMPDFVRSIPLSKALDPDTLLAFQMNGEPLPHTHGFPLRLVVPGWAGNSWVKWVTDIQVLDKEYDGFFMKSAYRRPVRPVEPGTAVDPAAMIPVTMLGPKSVIASPLNGEKLAEGPVAVRGAAWAGESPLARVDVSTDSGRTWRAAKLLGSDQANYAWRLWEVEWKAPGPGSYVLLARASDRAGNTQPLVQDWNPSGYLWNVVHQVRVEIGSAVALPAAEPKTVVPPFPPKVQAACLGCHGQDVMVGQKLTQTQWEREVDKMIRWGAAVNPGDRAELVDFLSSHFR